MEQLKYRIGDVAGMMGMSRDTLRYYEKRGLICSRKAGNGYRYYTNQDIARLSSILFQRRMNLPLDDMESLWNEKRGSTVMEQLPELIQTRINEETEAIRSHQQTIARLQMSLEDAECFCTKRETPSLQELPASYIIVPSVPMEDSIETYLQQANLYSGMDMGYLLDEYSWEQENGTLKTTYKNTCLILHQDRQDFVDYPFERERPALIEETACVCAFQVSNRRTPDPEKIREMLAWAQSQGLIASQKLYATVAMHGLKNGEFSLYLQLFIPVF